MRDPHVVSLRYRLVTDDATSFDNPPPVERETDAFRLRLEDGVATVEMVEHYSSEQSARGEVEPYFRAWEVDSALRQNGRQEIRFEFENSRLIDRDPPPPGSPQIISAKAISITLTTGRAVAHIARRRYPTPPDEFVLSPDAETLWHRYQGYLNGQEPLASMGYLCLTLLEARAERDQRANGKGKREKAADLYGISRNILRTLGRLTGPAIGDDLNIRKFAADSIPRPHTIEEKAWVEAAVRELILRIGQWASEPNKSLPKLTMADLPKL